MGATSIEWTEYSWNPIRAKRLNGLARIGHVGWHCEHVSPGCEHCYAEGINKRLGTGIAFKPGHRKDIEIFLDEKMLLAPLKWRKPRRIFVCSMTDLFADFVKDEWIDRMFAVMALAPQHRFQILTKRSKRMREYVNDAGRRDLVASQIRRDDGEGHRRSVQRRSAGDLADMSTEDVGARLVWPLPNCWTGVSAEDQERADERIPDLLATPAAVRFVSLEPLLGQIQLNMMPDWVIVGGESGPRARPMHQQWACDIRDQCKAAGVAFFMKQMTKKAPIPQHLMIREMPDDMGKQKDHPR